MSGQRGALPVNFDALMVAESSAHPELVNRKDTPHLIGWIERINDRPAAKQLFAEVPRERLERPAQSAARSA